MLNLKNRLFNINTEQEFNEISIEIFNYQYTNNKVYHEFCKHLGTNASKIKSIDQIPFLPIEFFKTHCIITGDFKEQHLFLSSGTTGTSHSKHFIKDLTTYEKSFNSCFEHFYGSIKDYCIIALLPSYMEQEGSSLIYMVNHFINSGNHQKSGFFIENESKMIENLHFLTKNGQKMILIGVSYALLDLAENHELDLKHVIVMETGGMKGRRKELTRNELHNIYKKNFNISVVHSEYGMTELLSQAYSKGNGIFQTPNWMKILIRDVNDPFSIIENNKTGGINVIDLANIDSCSFIATQDLGKITDKGFEVLGRFDNSDLRGCNLLIN